MSDALPHISKAMAQGAQYVQATWQRAVMGQLAIPGAKEIQENVTLRQLYAGSIVLTGQLRDGQTLKQSVVTTMKFARQIENGCGPFDMKPALLGGPKAKISKKGNRYNIIPFRHGTSSDFAPNSNFKPMPKDIYQQARELKASVKAGSKMKWGGRLTGTEGKYGPGENPSTGYQHKNGKYEGMVRVEKTYRAATQSKYLTFRVVSDLSDPLSWFHPGYQAHHIAKSVSDYCRPGIETLLKEAATADLLDGLNLDITVT